MAFYELHLNCFLKVDTPLEILETLMFMVSKDKIRMPDIAINSRLKLFNIPNWATFLSDEIQQFPFINSSLLTHKINHYILTVHSSFLIKSNELIMEFLKFIEKYVIDDIFLGYYRQPNDNPILLRLENDKIIHDKP
jgi:hypothetical protein